MPTAAYSRRLDPDAANCAYELTFLFAAVVSFVYVKFIRHDRFLPKREGPKYVGALFETAGQFAYIYAIADEDHVMYAAPIISAYCAASVLWSRIFLREKLSWRHYLMLLLIVVGHRADWHSRPVSAHSITRPPDTGRPRFCANICQVCNGGLQLAVCLV